ncbi:PEP-CTERM sorting domain-containing protein [Phycisphaerales bacterium AB-hyl4]|uniref:PEP-CTERM sorting domain-containing protein n=1 Tax=Natronomicrosphaera hydrolytica TaxID=3242702 RepID=A0ABV4U7M8_9BACT
MSGRKEGIKVTGIKRGWPGRSPIVMLLAFCMVLGMTASATFAAPINYGNFEGQGVWFNDVREDSSTSTPPLYQEPGVPITVSSSTSGSTVVDQLVFSPDADFASFSPTSTGANADTTDGVLKFTLQAKPGQTISSVRLTEFGDWSLVVLSGGEAIVNVGGGLFAVEGANSSQSTINVSGLPANFTTTSSGTWNGWAELDLSAFAGDAIKISLDNTLQTASMNGAAFIAKKGFAIEVTSVPEPGTMILLAGGAVAMLYRRGRQNAAA